MAKTPEDEASAKPPEDEASAKSPEEEASAKRLKIELQNRSQLLEQLINLFQNKPAEATQIIRTWLVEGDKQKGKKSPLARDKKRGS